LNSLLFEQLLQNINLGIVIIDQETHIRFWNHWLARKTGQASTAVLGQKLTDLFPELQIPAFQRNLRSVFSFGNFAFFSQQIHRHLITLPHPGGKAGEVMDQHCTMGPLREAGDIVLAYITIEDVTETVERETRLTELSMRDVLTSAFNRRYFDHRLQVELDRCLRHERSLGLVMLDIDHFKLVNDRYGHQFGDTALRHIAAVWLKTARSTDVVCRYGGEEFCVLLPETEYPGALAIATRIQQASALEPVCERNICDTITVSAGLTISKPGDTVDSILKRADSALYQAKADGRNRLVYHG
jgi:diguanylate cyclase